MFRGRSDGLHIWSQTGKKNPSVSLFGSAMNKLPLYKGLLCTLCRYNMTTHMLKCQGILWIYEAATVICSTVTALQLYREWWGRVKMKHTVSLKLTHSPHLRNVLRVDKAQRSLRGLSITVCIESTVQIATSVTGKLTRTSTIR